MNTVFRSVRSIISSPIFGQNMVGPTTAASVTTIQKSIFNLSPNTLKSMLSIRLFGTSLHDCQRYGMEYQPNNLQRKRKHGYLKRMKTAGGREVIRRRKAKGRKHLSH